jgi:hypothetical protein
VQFRQHARRRGPETAEDATIRVCRGGLRPLMGITFREAVAEVELGLVAGDQLSDIATAGLLEGYESAALVTLAGQFGEPYDPVEVERLWTLVLGELHIPSDRRIDSARVLVRAYARQVAEGELPPQLGASKIAGLHRLTAHAGCNGKRSGDCIGAEGILALFYAHDGRGYLNPCESQRIDKAIMDECHRLAAEQPA